MPARLRRSYARPMELTAEEIRVLGCLVEKHLTTPQAYPLTESAVIAACNQSTNRDPVVAFDQTAVRRALLSLRQHGLAKMVHRPGDRVEKHRHLFDEALSLSPAQVAVLTVLMLRGPQTVGELRTRTERLHQFSDLAEVEAVVSELSSREPLPFVERAPRRPGQNQIRFRHLLGGDLDQVAEPTLADAGERAYEDSPGEPPAPRLPDVLAALQAEVSELRDRVARLETELGVDRQQ